MHSHAGAMGTREVIGEWSDTFLEVKLNEVIQN